MSYLLIAAGVIAFACVLNLEINAENLALLVPIFGVLVHIGIVEIR